MTVIFIIISAVVGVACGYYIGYYLKTSLLQIELNTMRRDAEREDGASDAMKIEFSNLSRDLLKLNSEEFLRLAETKMSAQADLAQSDLDAKRSTIVDAIKQAALVTDDLKLQTAGIRADLKNQVEQQMALRETTDGLRLLLSSSQQRGRWGERTVEDMIDKIGLKKNVSYETQRTMKDGSRPDFTFSLPGGMSINLDVKFPLDNYEAYLNADSDFERDEKKKAFIKDVRGHVKTLAGKGYISPGEGTVDYMMAFIPHEGMYAFIHESDPEMMDYALESGILLCAPLTLYAMLSLVRQSVKSFAIEQRAGDILALMRDFLAEWVKYGDVVDKLGRSLETAQADYNKMITTRAKGLERKVTKIVEIQEVVGEAGAPPALEIGEG